jgi:hypothetical protein
MPNKKFTPYSFVPKGLYNFNPALKEQEEEAKGIMFSQLDNPNYSEEYRDQIRNFVNSQYTQPDTFDRNPGVLLSAFNPYALVERNGLSEYYTSKDEEGYEADLNPHVFLGKDKDDVINLPLELIKMKGAPKDVLAHEITHTKQKLVDDYDVTKAFGGEKSWQDFVNNLYETVPEGKKRERHPYLVRNLGNPENFLTGEGGDRRTYIGNAAYGMPNSYSPLEIFSDFQAMRQQSLADGGYDVTRTQLFKDNVFRGNKKAEKAFYKYMDILENR